MALFAGRYGNQQVLGAYFTVCRWCGNQQELYCRHGDKEKIT